MITAWKEVCVDIEGFVDQLGGPVEADREAAEQALIAIGKPAVGPLLNAVCDESSWTGWGASASVLRRIGDAAFDPLVAVFAAEPSREVSRRCESVFVYLEVSDKAIYVSALTHPSARVREQAVLALEWMKEQAEPYVRALAALFDDPDAFVRQRAIRAFDWIGPVSIPLLRQIRRGGGRRRAPVLTALANVGGWDALDETDQRAVTRLIEIKSANEVPKPMYLCDGWYALPTTDQAAVLDAFGLVASRPVTMRMGESAWYSDQHISFFDEHPSCRRMYVTPGLDGWTLVFGELFTTEEHEIDIVPSDDIIRRCADLSTRFGAAHWYGANCDLYRRSYDDSWEAWCIAEAGEAIRYYDADEPDKQIGDTHPAEAGYLLPHEPCDLPAGSFSGIASGDSDAFWARFEQIKRELNIPDQATAAMIAARASVDPTALGPQTTVVGRAVIALTPCGVGRPSKRGALAI